MQKHELAEIVHLSMKELALSDAPLSEVENEEKTLAWLSGQILFLLRHNFDQLVNALYRIDVSEHKVKELFNGRDEILIAQSLAELIFEREKEKIETRRKYKN